MFRIGQGYDSHRLEESDGKRKLVIGGIEIPHDKVLKGHSDADVLTHAIIDSIFGALALGDIGKHFPDTDTRYKGISSVILLKETIEIMKNKNYKINNLDATIIAEKPKFQTHIEAIRKNLASVMTVEIEKISIKAKTNEKMGFIGKEEGIAVMAVVMLESLGV